MLKANVRRICFGYILLGICHQLQVTNDDSSSIFMAFARKSEANARAAACDSNYLAFDGEVWNWSVLHSDGVWVVGWALVWIVYERSNCLKSSDAE